MLTALIIFVATCLFSGSVNAQTSLPPNQPEQDACDAILLCGNSFTTPYSYQGIGTVADLTTTPCGGGEGNSMWIRLEINTGGIIVFTISPISVNDDYDFAVLDITNTACSTLTSANVIRCNFNNNYPGSNVNGVIGVNTTATIQYVYSGSTGNSFVQQITASPGDVYLIMINNFGNYNTGGPSQGFTIDFTGTTATFNQPPLPKFTYLLPKCDYRDSMTIQLSDNVLCSSIAADGSDFYLTPIGNIQNAYGIGCVGSAGYTDQVKIFFNTSLSNGDYILHAKVGTDNNTLLNLCGGALQIPDTLSFHVGHDPIDFLSLDTPACQNFTIHLSAPVNCASIASDGSDFKITGPSLVPVNGATGVGCTNGYTQTINVTIAQPIAVDGYYTLMAQLGNDGTTMGDTCGRSVQVGTSLPFLINSYSGLLTAHPDTMMCPGLLNLYPTNTATAPPGGFQYTWSPSSNLSSTNQANTTATIDTGVYIYHLTTIDAAGCYLRDSVVIQSFQAPIAAFTYNVGLGCMGDTVYFNNESDFANRYLWRFDVSNLTDTAASTQHVYTNPGTYFVTLIVHNDHCTDSASQLISLGHPLSVDFAVSDDTICEGTTISFTNNSTATTVNGIPPGNYWQFGNGDISNLENPMYTYDTPGLYRVELVVNNAVPCYDTMTHFIVVDSLPDLSVTVSDTPICKGDEVLFTGLYSGGGLVHSFWQFGDSSDSIFDVNPASHAYDQSGLFTISIYADYRSCPDTTISFPLLVKEVPYIKIGADTTLCLDGDPIVIEDLINKNNPNAIWVWNTGDTTSSITIRHPGYYWAKVTLDYCSSIDDIKVKKDCYIDIPNSFTPNGDGVNDYFIPRQKLSAGIVGFKISIWNRWGQNIFESSSINGRGWDGQFNGSPQPVGVYIYMIEAVYKNGRQETYKGNLTLIR